MKLKVRAGHSSTKITEQYIHLAGTAFHDDAERLSSALLLPRLLPISDDLSASEST
jgi:hypothetical protein